jgi:hypothetical protein
MSLIRSIGMKTALSSDISLEVTLKTFYFSNCNRLGLMVVGGIILASFMTYASKHLAIRSFLKGLEETDNTPNRSLCFLC